MIKGKSTYYLRKTRSSIFAPLLLLHRNKMVQSESIRVLRVSKQTSSPGTTPPNSVKLTFFDLFWHFTPPVQLVLFYDTNAHFPILVDKVRKALSLALQQFYPLAGKLVWSPESDEFEIQCDSERDGVIFIEAETDADFHRLVNESVHDVNSYKKLVPTMDISELPAPLLSVQFTRFVSGGVCIGVSCHHMSMDGIAFWNFMKSWAKICKSGKMLVHPCHDRRVIQDPHGETKSFLDILRPSLPKVKIRHFDSPKIMRRTFTISAANIHFLKLRAARLQSQPGSGRVSTFVAILAHIWVCSVRARQVREEETTTLLILADCRSRLDPPVVQWYFGNCMKPCIVQAKGFDLLGEPGFRFAVREIQERVRVTLEEPSKCIPSKQRRETVMTVASSPRFRVYETDFGWGKPNRVELVSMNGEGSLVLEAKRDEEGGVQASLALAPHHMEEFAELLFGGLEGSIVLLAKV